MMKTTPAALIVLALLLPADAAPAPLAAKTWTNGGATGLWSTAANWSPSGVPGAADTVTFDATSTAACTIDAGFTITSLTISATYGALITAQSVTISMGSFTMGDGEFDGTACTMDVDGNLVITDGIFRAPAGVLTVGGDLTMGTFAAIDHNDGEIVLDGAGTQSIYGQDWDFFDLTKSVTTAQTLAFEPILGAPVQVFGTLTLQGVAGNLLSLRSTTPGTEFYFSSEGPRAIAYVDVQDAWNASPSTIDAGPGSVDSGNNYDWNFGGVAGGDDDDDDRCGSVGLDLLLPLGLLLLRRRAAGR